MTIREFLNKNSPVVVICAILVLIGCVVFVLHTNETLHPPMIKNAYYYDLETGKIFIGPSDGIPPIPSPSGHKDPNGNNMGVRAILFSCGKCDDESSRFIGYLETLTPEAKEQMTFLRHQAELGIVVPPTGPVGMQPPAPPATTAPTTGPSTAPTSAPAMVLYDPRGNGRLISDPKNINWIPMVSDDATKITQTALSKCGAGKFPNQCFPDLK